MTTKTITVSIARAQSCLNDAEFLLRRARNDLELGFENADSDIEYWQSRINFWQDSLVFWQAQNELWQELFPQEQPHA